MKRLHLFNPDNDLALAANLANYTPPPAASRLRRAGEALPLWYGADGDTFASTGTDARWLDAMRGAFGMDVDVFPGRAEKYIPTPWGWSPAARTDFLNMGFEADALPSDAQLKAMRDLSHRRTATAIHALLPQQYLTAAAVEVHSFAELQTVMKEWPEAVVKLPWSSSGRGTLGISRGELPARRAAIEGSIRRQGSAMVEPKLPKGIDFAMLFDMCDGNASYRGLSLFDADISNGYAGNNIMPQTDMEAQIAAATGSEALCAVRTAMTTALPAVISDKYCGPVGVDFFTVPETGRIALAEMNLRRTMGRLCLDIADRYLAPGVRARFEVHPYSASTPPPIPPGIFNCRLRSGTLSLNPPASPFNFHLTILD